MIYFITDRRPNEPLHPPSIFREPLYITRLQCDGGALIATEQAPEGGWTIHTGPSFGRAAKCSATRRKLLSN